MKEMKSSQLKMISGGSRLGCFLFGFGAAVAFSSANPAGFIAGTGLLLKAAEAGCFG